MLYLDASALVKRYVDEGDGGTPFIDAVMEEPQRWGGLVSSEWLLLEVTSALTRKLRSGRLDASTYAYLLRRFRNDAEGLGLIEVGSEVIRAAAGMMEAVRGVERFHSGDAIHLYTAQQLSSGVPEHDAFLFVTTDVGLMRTAQAIGMQAVDPRTQPVAHLEAIFPS
ncbi:MAG TPA: type II toxin-antitoxin system VapC family toxin [Longimicrobiaceae bacterium]|nr:type II toxin-antitoxin system VapC family toxin [Longimicrobiaceae bacterium]